MSAIHKALRREIATENAKWPDRLIKVEKESWIAKSWDTSKRIEVWRSKKFMVQVFDEGNGMERLSISRTDVLSNGHWVAGITWEDLQDLKWQCERGDKWAVEMFPAQKEIVDVANMRHLWVLPEPPFYGWHPNP